jgi:EAL domain-containing protein (putative c-di-GMP-specific phosphodiesterase class I)/DNA-binding NarL/FixJ family response regulator
MSMEDKRNTIASALIVDDSAVQRAHAVRLCRAAGIERIETASNGDEALSLLSVLTPPPAHLIIDLEMPGMDGAALLEQLQKRGIDIPIIVVSSRGEGLIELVSDMGRLLGLRIAGALQKPLSAETLLPVLNNSVAGASSPGAQTSLPLHAQDLAAGIERGELHVHYQPKVCIRTGILRGVEALARWEHPTLGFVPPGQFIALAEQNELIHPLTMRVVNDAMRQTASWMAQGLHLSVAINMSAQLLDRSDLTDEIVSLQQGYGVSAERVIFEITEGSVVSGRGVALGVLARFRLKGFGLSIDDYGTGFSSLQQLARIPFTELKIDRSFVHRAYERKNRQVILRSALEMASKLGIASVAEGVETMEDWRLLQQFGCTLGQGFLIAKPMCARDLPAWLKDYRPRRAKLCIPEGRGAVGFL